LPFFLLVQTIKERMEWGSGSQYCVFLSVLFCHVSWSYNWKKRGDRKNSSANWKSISLLGDFLVTR
jgi:hypothetical protein